MTVGVLAMSYGTPLDVADIPRYYTDIRHGRPPPPDLLTELTDRYLAIGGTFPLRAITEAQAAELDRQLAVRSPGGYTVALGCKHSPPTVEDGVRELAGRGAERVIGLVLAPHYSAFSVGEYAARARKAGEQAGLAVQTVESWHLLPAYLDFLAAAVADALAGMPRGCEVVFTAHSLPERILAAGDPYPTQLRQTAAAVAERAGLERWSIGWQSAGRTPEPWLGPDIRTVLRDRAAGEAAGVVVCPCGFVADHLEVAYDLDIEAAKLAGELGLPFARTRSLGADPTVMSALGDLLTTR
jgi:ferrochelatase